MARPLATATALIAVLAIVLPAGAAPKRPPPRCHTSALSLRVLDKGAGLGSAFYLVVLRNKSTHSCSLKGYPGVSLLDRNHRQVGPSAKRLRSSTPKRFTLKPGKAGSARWTVGHNACNGGNPPRSIYVRVIPPDETTARVRRHRVAICRSQIEPLRRGVRQ